jgi:hypothetical protein
MSSCFCELCAEADPLSPKVHTTSEAAVKLTRIVLRFINAFSWVMATAKTAGWCGIRSL